MRLGIIFGGRSGEHEISLMSAASVIDAIDKEKFQLVLIGITKEGHWLLYDGPVDKIQDGSWQQEAEEALRAQPEKYGLTILGAGGKSLKDVIDFALPILHGPYGEDGTIQGLLEMADIPYGGCGVVGSAAAMDKALAKDLFIKAELPVCRHLVVYKEELAESGAKIAEKVKEFLSYPVFVKPANLGSSVGISKARNQAELMEALAEAGRFDRKILIEEGLNCREVETGVLGNYHLKVAGVGEILPSGEFYDYKAKYFDDGKSKLCIPADIPSEISEEIKVIAQEAYRVLDCNGYARVDFFLERESNRIILNEINTIPGFTKYSLFPLIWQEAGLTYSALIEEIIRLGLERFQERKDRA